MKFNLPKLNILKIDSNLIFPYKLDCGSELTLVSAKRDINHVKQDCETFLWITCILGFAGQIVFTVAFQQKANAQAYHIHGKCSSIPLGTDLHTWKLEHHLIFTCHTELNFF